MQRTKSQNVVGSYVPTGLMLGDSALRRYHWMDPRGMTRYPFSRWQTAGREGGCESRRLPPSAPCSAPRFMGCERVTHWVTPRLPPATLLLVHSPSMWAWQLMATGQGSKGVNLRRQWQAVARTAGSHCLQERPRGSNRVGMCLRLEKSKTENESGDWTFSQEAAVSRQGSRPCQESGHRFSLLINSVYLSFLF